MGPLFAFLCIIVLGGALVICSFLFFRISHPGKSALAKAVAFTGGALLGLIVAVLSATLVIGVRATLQTVTGMNLYFSWLGACSLLGGLAAVKLSPLVLRHFRTALADPHPEEVHEVASAPQPGQPR